MHGLLVALLVVGLTAGSTAVSSAAGEVGIEPGRVYRGTAEGLKLKLLALEPEVDDETVVLIDLDGVCDDDYPVNEAFVTTVDGRGRFDLRERVEHDETDNRWRVRGTFAGDTVSGRVEASLSSSDDGDEFSCDIDERQWAAKAGKPHAGLERIEATLAIPALADPEAFGVHVATGPDAVYVAVESVARIVRIDPATNSVAWDAAVDADPAALAATSDAVWVLDTGTEDAVVRLDPSNGEEQARLGVGPFFMGSIAAAGDSIWVAGYEEPGSNQGTILRIDPATATVTATIEVEGFEPAELAAGSQGLYALGIRRDPETTGSAGGGIVRIDPVGGEIVTRADIPEDEEIAVSDDGVFLVGLISPILRLDPVTLEVIESTRREAYTMTAAPPGTWGDTARGVTAFDVALDPVVTVPVTSVTGALELAAGFGSVWMLEGRLGVVVRIRAGA